MENLCTDPRCALPANHAGRCEEELDPEDVTLDGDDSEPDEDEDEDEEGDGGEYTGEPNLFGESLAKEAGPSYWEVRRAAILACTDEPDSEMVAAIIDAVRHSDDGHNDEWKNRITDCQIDMVRGSICDHYEPGPYIAAIAHLVKLGAMTPHETHNEYSLDLSRFPDPPRDHWADTLNYIAHHLTDSTLSHHWLKYRVNVYRHEDREVIVERLKAEGYIDKSMKILKRPEGSTVQIWEHSLKGNTGEVSLTAALVDGMHQIIMSARVTMKCGLGLHGPVWNKIHGQWWEDRAAGIAAAWLAIVEQLEECHEHAIDEGNPKAAKVAVELRAWVEQQAGYPIPRQIAADFAEQMRARRADVSKARTPGTEEDEEYETEETPTEKPPAKAKAKKPYQPASLDGEQGSLF